MNISKKGGGGFSTRGCLTAVYLLRITSTANCWRRQLECSSFMADELEAHLGSIHVVKM